MIPLLKLCADVLDKSEVRYEQLKDKPILRVTSGGKNASFDTFIDVTEDKNVVHSVSFCPITVPEHRANDIRELLCLINDRMIIGRFILKENDILLKTSLMNGKNLPDKDAIFHLFFSNIICLDGYVPLISQVAHGMISADKAIAYFESDIKEKTDEVSPNRLSGMFDNLN